MQCGSTNLCRFYFKYFAYNIYTWPIKMRRMNNLVTLFFGMFAFFFGSFITTLLSNIDDKCPTQKSGIHQMESHPELFLIVLILTAPENWERRQVLRETWLGLARPLTHKYFPENQIYLPQYDKHGFLQNQDIAEQAKSNNDFKIWLENAEKPNDDRRVPTTERHIKVQHFLAIGTQNMDATLKQQLNREHAQHKDLLLLPRLYDSYSNLTEKLLHSIDALTNHYNFSYILKVDDDTYVRLDLLLNELISYDRKLIRKASEYRYQPLPELYWGYFNGRASIKSAGRWREEHYFLAQRYITYALGGGYIISRRIAEFITANSHFLSTFVSEDVSLGTWLAPLRHIYRRHDIRFDTGYMPRPCRRYHLVLHKRNLSQLRDLHAGKLCIASNMRPKQQLHLPPEYFYDWHRSADKCCDTSVP